MSVYKSRVSVPEAVRRILTRNHAIYECLKMKLINFHSLTERIQALVQGPPVERPASIRWS